ncbi:MAG: hypothetical protein J6V72_13730 [Kiritimatiellae bacterium]|nr:hypothetical protein [Kiritimatiellia bacterium]
MKNSPLIPLAALPLALCALDLSDKTDIRFAESYAFSTNRAELVATLPPESKGWFTYSILNAEIDGRFKDAHDLVSRWQSKSHVSGCFDRETYADLLARLTFHEWNDGSIKSAPASHYLRYTLKRYCGIEVEARERKVQLAPNTYPSRLGEDAVSFSAFWNRRDYRRWIDLDENFAFLPMIGEKDCADPDWDLQTACVPDGFLYDVPGYCDFLRAYFTRYPGTPTGFTEALKGMPLDQLVRLAEGLKGSPQDLRGAEIYAKTVLSKLGAGADDDPNDYLAAVELAKRRIAFVDTLLPALARMRRTEYQSYLKLRGAHGDWEDARAEFAMYLNLCLAERHRQRSDSLVSPDALVTEYLSAFRRAGDDLSAFSDMVEQKALARICAEADLLAGRSLSDADAQALSAAQFKALQERVELNWAKSNPKVFAADADVALALDVKNVKRLRLSVYVIDPFTACRVLDGEVKSDIDLDAAVPTFTRTFDYPSLPQVVRHTETFKLPELKEPGLYVVECSGEGISSRALVRKGRLRVTERRCASGHVFTAIDEAGKPVKGARLRLDGTLYAADEDGEIAVPFAADAKSAGRKTAVATDGRLASTIAFTHAVEEPALELKAFLPDECLVAGRTATALLRLRLRISGADAPLGLLKNPVLTMTFVDQDGNRQVKPCPDAVFADDAECAVSFTVPARLRSVSFTVSGSITHAVTEKVETLEASTAMSVNGVCDTDMIGQAFMRRTASGWRLELRGRTGEPLSARALPLTLKHRAFKATKTLMLQADEQGVVELGRLADISSVSLKFEGHGYRWDTSDDAVVLPPGLTAAEGEAFELPVRDLFAGEWPGAKRLAVRVSLLALNRAGEVTGNCISACSYTNGILRIAGLPAGDYRLTLRDRRKSCRLSVAKTAANPVAGGVVAGLSRSLTDTGSPNLMRIASAAFDKSGAITVRLAHATPGARIHVVASRTREGTSACARFAGLHAWRRVSYGSWGGRPTEYVSGRDLGDKLRYVLDRRDQPARVGNMLFRPSLLLTPWSTSETATTDVTLRDGMDWEAGTAPAAAAEEDGASATGAPFGGGGRAVFSPCLDFLPQAATVVANVRPDTNGVATIDFAKVGEAGLGAQDVFVLVTDGQALDGVELLGEPTAFTPRNLGHVNADPGKTAARTKSYRTVGELFTLMRSLNGSAPLGEFEFLASWTGKTQEEKRALYGRYASHELDFFLHEKDPEFFKAVVVPNLRNKRLKKFVDKWLLDEDLSEWTAPGRLDDLNAFEQGLLALRERKFAPVIARRMADWCAAHPANPDIGLDEALGTMEEVMEDDVANSAAPRELPASAPPAAARPAAFGAMAMDAAAVPQEFSGAAAPGNALWSNQMSMKPGAALRMPMKRSYALSDKRKAAVRRAKRPQYRPPERTREWVETHYWKARQNEDTSGRVAVNEFWRDWTAAIAEGREGAFMSDAIRFVHGSDTITPVVAALSVTKLPFAAKDGDAGLVFTRDVRPGADGAQAAVAVTQRFRDPKAARADGTTGAAVSDEFVRGRVYELVTVMTNPTDENRRMTVFGQIPSGAFALSGARGSFDKTVRLGPYSSHCETVQFYFPSVGEKVGALVPAVAVEAGGATAAAQPFTCRVVAASTKTDTTSWDYVSQNGSKEAVLDYLRTKNLSADSVDLAKILWRMKDGAYARQVLDALAARGVYCQELWLAGLVWADTYDPARVREALMRRENRTKLGRRLGALYGSLLVTLDAEDCGVFEHKEYWPIVNARAHTLGGTATIANEGLKREYRAFLDMLAQKKAPSARDRVLAAVYLLAQDRVDEAKAQLALADGALPDAETRMQRDYLRAYLAFCDGDAAKGREIARPYADWPVPLWRDRFRDVIAQADEALGDGSAAAQSPADRVPAIAAKAVEDGGAVTVVLATRNLAACTLKAYPTDVEIAFSKDPFGAAADGREVVRSLKPAWQREVALSGDETRVELPAELVARNFVLVAEGADGRAEARLEVTPCAFVVQVLRECRQLRVKGKDGKPLVGAYVKVYAKDASGSAIQFHKDGYTDLRGAFDYASISTDSSFKPAEFAVLVLPKGAGASIQRIPAH